MVLFHGVVEDLFAGVSGEKMGKNRQIPGRVEEVVATALEVLVGPTTNRGVMPAIEELLTVVERTFRETDERQCLAAGLWLLAGELEKAHVICQEVPSVHGSAWHAVVHRMEGDFWNSKYWWRRASGVKWVGLMERAAREIVPMPGEMTFLKSRAYDPAAFVDVVEAHHRRGSAELHTAMAAMQRLECIVLFEECWIAAADQASNA
jgi:hypothetical protein